MRILRRLALVSLFSVAGVVVALCVGFSTRPPSTGPQARDAAAPGRAETIEDAPRFVLAPSPPPTSLKAFKTEVAPADPLPWTISVPQGPVVAEAHPARTFQVSSGEQSSGLLKTLRFWKRVATPLFSRVARDSLQPAPEPAPLAASAERSTIVLTGPAVPPEPSLPLVPSAPPVEPAETETAASRPAPGEGDHELSMQFPNNDIREVLDALSIQGNLKILATESVKGKITATLNGVDVESALDAILKSTGYVARRDGDFIYVGKPEDFDSLEKSLDRISTRVYRPNYVTAAELEALIQPLVTAGTGVVSVSSPAEVGIAADSDNAGGDAFAGGEVVVVRDYEAVLAEIDQVVREIDVRPTQVAIEAMILSVTLDDGNDFGVSFELLRDKGNVRLGWGTPLDSLASLKFDKGGLKFGFLDSSLGAFIEALESIGDTNVIATPRLMVVNKHRAEILIGEELGYVSTTMTETSTSQSVEFLEVGTQLRLRPFISSDGLIRMEVHPELSTGSVDTSNPNFTLPNKKTTKVTTNIMVRDGCTVIIGGLIRDELETTGKQVPFFGSLPVVGVAFRSRNEKLKRREILVLITPHIAYEPETCAEGEKGACEFHRRQDVYREQMNPLSQRHVARRYFRMAQNAWAAGDRSAALRFAELAVHFDPLNRAAIDLRSDIWMGQRAPTEGWSGDHTLDGPLPTGPPTASLDGAVIDPWLLKDLQQEPVPLPEPLHPLDPGRPGRSVDIERPRSFQ